TAAIVQAALAKVGAAIVAADGVGNGADPAARLVRGVLLELAAFERELIRARIRAALAVKKCRGELTGAPPYGYRAVEGSPRAGRDGVFRPVKVLKPDEAEQATLARVRELRAAGKTIRKVIAALAREGRVSRTGKPFTVAAMHAMLRHA